MQLRIAFGLILVCVALTTSPIAAADEGGVSFWLPGQFGSFASVPGSPGWSLGAVYFHSSADAGGDRSFPRSGRITAGLDANADLLFLAPNYIFGEPVLGGQAAIAVTGVFGRVKVDIDATLTGPNGGTLSGSEVASLTAGGDLYGLGSIKWTNDVHNFMAYAMVGAPVGAYEPDRLANIGSGHAAFDVGGGYTYFDKKNEFSAALGFTYNLENPDTDYQNGVDAHLDWAASRFISEQTHVGVAGYFFDQVSGDSGDGATLGDFKSRIAGIGPQLGHFYAVGQRVWYLNLKGFYEFSARNRPEGWNVWVTLSIPLSAPQTP